MSWPVNSNIRPGSAVARKNAVSITSGADALCFADFELPALALEATTSRAAAARDRVTMSER
jgi:hypothetical protein